MTALVPPPPRQHMEGGLTPGHPDHGDQWINELLTHMVAVGGSDLHLTAGIAPCIRVNGALVPLPDTSALLPADTERMVRTVLSYEHWERFVRTSELDTSYSIPRVSRFRLNVYRQRGAVGAVFRSIPHTIRPLAELGMPDSVESLAMPVSSIWSWR